MKTHVFEKISIKKTEEIKCIGKKYNLVHSIGLIMLILWLLFISFFCIPGLLGLWISEIDILEKICVTLLSLLFFYIAPIMAYKNTFHN